MEKKEVMATEKTRVSKYYKEYLKKVTSRRRKFKSSLKDSI